MKKIIVDCESGEIIERELTKEELEQLAIGQAEQKQKELQEKLEAEKKAALLEKLGITEEEARLLLG